MPEQGLNGYATITSLAHFRFTKIPEENSANDYELQPITGIFEHTSNDVWELVFDNGDTLGVTAAHPIYSEDVGDWRLAGELVIGEVVKTMDGTAILLQKRQVEAQRVFNLEVREVHNFLVGDGRLVVHNLCHKDTRKFFKEKGIRAGDKNHPPAGTSKSTNVADNTKIKKNHPDARVDDNGKIKICYDDFGFPGFRKLVPKLIDKKGIEIYGIAEIPNMLGENSKDFKAALDILKTKLPEDSPVQSITAGKVPFEIDGIKYTFHHHHDGKSMMLVPSSINNPATGGVSHIGGSTIVKKEKPSPFKEFGPLSDKDYTKTKCE